VVCTGTVSPLERLFAEELGLVIEVADEMFGEVMKTLNEIKADAHDRSHYLLIGNTFRKEVDNEVCI